jgi:hypothetical protein
MMAHFPASDKEYCDLICDDDYRSYLIARSDAPGGYRFGRTQGRRARIHGRTALGRINGYLKNMIEVIANSKLRRMERELELRGVCLDRSESKPASRSRASK